MSELIIIAGPQAAGKSTTIARLSEQYAGIAPLFGRKRGPLIFPLQESRQIFVHMHMLLGGIFMTPEQEYQIIACDFERMDAIARRASRRIVYLDECNVFTLAHAAAHGVAGVQDQLANYVRRLQALRAKVIFLDIPPSVSWDRRKRSYEKRLVYFPTKDHARLMSAFERHLHKVHPLLLETYEKLPLPKRLIDARQPNRSIIAQASAALSELSTSFR